MGMPVAQKNWSACPRRAMGINKRLRVDFEMSLRQGMDIATRDNRVDRPAPSEQQSASLQRMRREGMCQELLDQRA